MSLLTDGFKTLITFADDPTVTFYEKEVTPPGLEGSGSHDTSTMRNTAWRTFMPGNLKTLTECSFSAAYDPNVFSATNVQQMIQKNQQITVTFPDGAELAFWGWLESFVPDAHTEGEQPTAQVTIIPSNMDDSLDEAAPAYTAGP